VKPTRSPLTGQTHAEMQRRSDDCCAVCGRMALLNEDGLCAHCWLEEQGR